MLDIFLKSDNPFVRITAGALVVWGGLAIAVGIGLIPEEIGRNIALLGLLMVVIWNYGNKAKQI